MPSERRQRSGFARSIEPAIVSILALIALIGMSLAFVGHIWGTPRFWYDHAIIALISSVLLWGCVLLRRGALSDAEKRSLAQRAGGSGAGMHLSRAIGRPMLAWLIGMFVIAMLVSGGGWNADTWDVILSPRTTYHLSRHGKIVRVSRSRFVTVGVAFALTELSYGVAFGVGIPLFLLTQMREPRGGTNRATVSQGRPRSTGGSENLAGGATSPGESNGGCS